MLIILIHKKELYDLLKKTFNYDQRGNYYSIFNF